MKQIILLLIAVSFQFTVFGQNSDIRLYQPNSQDDSAQVTVADTVIKKQFDLNFKANDGTVNVNSDSRIQALTEFLGTPQNGQGVVKMQGYRLQIYYDQEKNNVNQKRADYLARYNEEPAFINYKAPNFRLRVGNFRTRLQAEHYMNEIKVDWPDAIIVEDDIELPELD